MYYYQFLGTGIFQNILCKVSVLETVPEVINYTCHLSIKVCEQSTVRNLCNFFTICYVQLFVLLLYFYFNFTLLYTVKYFRRIPRRENKLCCPKHGMERCQLNSTICNWFWKFSVIVYLNKGEIRNRSPEQVLVYEINKIQYQLYIIENNQIKSSTNYTSQKTTIKDI